jgi:hypothetical protein
LSRLNSPTAYDVGWVTAIFILAFLVRFADQIGLPPHPDDLLHFYAARSYLEDGSFSIFQGTYTRASDFTLLVAASLAVFGDSLLSARMPALVCGAALAAAVYIWVHREVGRGPAVLAAAVLILLAPAIDVSVLVRFYTLQSILFWLGSAAIYLAVSGRRSWLATSGLVLFGMLALLEAARLQVASAIGIAGLMAWTCIYGAWRLWGRASRTAILTTCVAVLVLAAISVWFLFESGIGLRLFRTYRDAALWAVPQQYNFKYYYYEMSREFGMLLDLLPLAAVAAIIWYPRQAIYCSTILVVGLVLQSFGGMKAQRYVSYLLPFFACLWGMAGWRLVLALRDEVIFRFPALRRQVPGLTLGLAAFCGILVVKAVPALELSARSIVVPGFDRPRDSRDQSWRLSRDALRPLMERVEIFVADDDLLADFHVGRADLVLNRSRLLENDPPDEFVRDFRSGTPTISSDASIRMLLACFDSGLIVKFAPFLSWLSPDTLTLLREHTRRLELPDAMAGFAWEARYGEAQEGCEPIRRLVAETSRLRRGAQ